MYPKHRCKCAHGISVWSNYNWRQSEPAPGTARKGSARRLPQWPCGFQLKVVAWCTHYVDNFSFQNFSWNNGEQISKTRASLKTWVECRPQTRDTGDFWKRVEHWNRLICQCNRKSELTSLCGQKPTTPVSSVLSQYNSSITLGSAAAAKRKVRRAPALRGDSSVGRAKTTAEVSKVEGPKKDPPRWVWSPASRGSWAGPPLLWGVSPPSPAWPPAVSAACVSWGEREVLKCPHYLNAFIINIHLDVYIFYNAHLNN